MTVRNTVTFFDSVTALVKTLLQVVTVLVTQIHVLVMIAIPNILEVQIVHNRSPGGGGWLRDYQLPVNFSEFLV